MSLTIFDYLIPPLFFLSLIIANFIAFKKYRRTSRLISLYENAEWVAIPATIESSSIEKNRVPRSSAIIYYLRISYCYKYNGTEFRSSTISSGLPDGMCSNEMMANKLAALLSSGFVITAFVNKHSPSTAVLSLNDVVFTPSSNVWSYGLMTLFGCFGFLSSFLYLFHFLGHLNV